MGFNTYGKREKTIGGSLVVWYHVEHAYPSGGTIDILGMGLSAGDIIPAGSMCALDFAGGTLKIVPSTATVPELEEVNGLLLNDVSIEEGNDYATGAVVYEGTIYEERLADSVPDDAKARMPRITFLKERP